MKYLRKYNESTYQQTTNDILENLLTIFVENFHEISDELDDKVLMYYSYYNMNRRVNFMYDYPDTTRDYKSGSPTHFNNLVDNSTSFRLVFQAKFPSIRYTRDIFSGSGTIQGFNQLGEPIIDVGSACEYMKFISTQLPMVVDRLKDTFDDVVVNISSVGSFFEVTASCDKETTKKVGIRPELIGHNKVILYQ